ncbi:hypothetical protein TcasGA2_TC000420 [Tribolium castaneum]|uniref:Uncharacterized protein n=1 Tax=Tribolium castaneum TaxID=7070 RepID=D6WAE0_TRICA|nr:hypothetical protein TcasGA2_TC000420 [Tribolium castaneum]
MRHKIKLCRHNREQSSKSIGCEIECAEQDAPTNYHLFAVKEGQKVAIFLRKFLRLSPRKGERGGNDANGGYGTNDVQEMNEHRYYRRRQQVWTRKEAKRNR